MRHAVRRGFSLIELVIVVVIIGIIAAIAIPRMSRGAAGAADAALSGNLTILRNAIDLFHTEHGGTDADWPKVLTFEAQLTTYTKLDGTANATKTGEFIFGPYLRAIPPLPVGSKKGQTGVAAAVGATVGWVYDESTGAIQAALADGEVDANGKKYNAY
ncbi:MAG: prepilin-type N-terminal cleavage/methylation domain-containing protein [Planctomycetota bacterium]|nr:prepilin-type N-terminal cleavage/methylation domain-containing protein [Planctomycetota bacterium]